MRPAAAVAVAAALALFGARAPAQEAAPAQPGAPAAPPAQPAAPGAPDLQRQTLPIDIQTADYYELVAWCRNLGLPETGSKADLQARLYAHYGVQPPPEEAKPARVIVVQSARSTDYFTIEGIKEDYLILQGDVRVEFRDTQAGVSHRVSADRLIVNQTRRTLSASGGVTYELARKTGAPEVFHGESFTFDLSGWGGLIIDGRGQGDRVMKEGQPAITFFYQGESIIRRSNETVILVDGSVTSSIAEDPYWQIAASRIWVLGPGEWAISNAVLKVGRVPLFYLPFYFKAGDEIVFHPALGYRNREGNFIQTTTYLVGQAEQKPSTLQFLQITGDQTSYDTQLEGIFLHKTTKEGGAPQGPAKPPDKDVFKIMADYYARLGWFGGVVMVLDPALSVKGGVGFSRRLYEQAAGTYSPYPPASTESTWDTVQVAGLDLPFRFGIDTNASLSGKPGSLQAAISLFSDPYFSSDFYNRAERIDWTGLLAGPQATTAAPTPSGLDPSTRDNLSWTATGRYKISPAPPWIDDLEISRIDLALYWQGRDNADYNPATDGEDPARRFFAHASSLWPVSTGRSSP